ncbi:MAG: hypothetical protein ACD_29C00400G0001 [uncultured bacterium]|nr:MAG: hypothetical protein ACD_29C00400G0001 [uncultured bacterium]
MSEIAELQLTTLPTDLTVDQTIMVRGEHVLELPKDLYIPPDALRVFLETFQGPLDLLLYLIKKQNLDILDIPIKKITIQYMRYVELMQHLHLELAGEYLLMAAMLAEIKSRLLLPRPPCLETEEATADPRLELIRRLQQYERFKKAAEDLSDLPQVERDIFVVQVTPPLLETCVTPPAVLMQDVLDAFVTVMTRVRMFADHKVETESLSVRERMLIILDKINSESFVSFVDFFKKEEGRMGVVVTFIAMLELIRQATIEIVQAQPFAPIYIKARN